MSCEKMGIVLAVLAACLFICGETARGDFVFGEPTKVTEINSTSSDSLPYISSDGLELYFQSNRPHGGNACFWDIWTAKRSTIEEPWSAPVKLDLVVNADGPVASPCISSDGLELYFSDGWQPLYDGTGCQPNPDGYGKGDLWVVTRGTKDDRWGDPHNLGSAVNSQHTDDTPSISADGLSLYFMAWSDSGIGLYVTTRKTKDDPWGPSVNLGPPVNQLYPPASNPFVSPDGLSLFYSVGAWLTDIYVSQRPTTNDPWGPRVAFDPVNLPDTSEYRLTYASGDSTLYFARGNDYAAVGTFDIWQVEVTPIVDFNGDGAVDATDLSILIDHWGQNAPSCDISPIPLGDGVVGDEDLEVLYEHVDTNLAVVPTPALNETGVTPFASLSWTRGSFAETYDIYFGTSFADVDNASRDNPMGVLVSEGQDANTYDPVELLELGQIYHWRVDEVNALSDPAIVKGVIWSFTTEPFAGPIKNIVATASSAEEGAGPERTIDGSGLTAEGLHSTTPTTMWLSAPDGSQPTWIQYEFDIVYPLDALWVWNYNGQFEKVIGTGFKDVTIEHSEDGTSWSTLGDVEFLRGTSQRDYSYNTVVDFGGVAAKYVRLTANSNWGGLMPQYGLSEVQFFYVPPLADDAEAADN